MKPAPVFATILPTGDRLFCGVTIRCGAYPSRCWYVAGREFRTLGDAKAAVLHGPPPARSERSPRPARRVQA